MPPDRRPLEDRLRVLFLEELDENVALLNRGLLALEALVGEPPSPQLLAELFRAAHSLKGAAHSAGVASAVRISHRLEDRLGALRAGTVTPTQETLSSLFSDVDALAGEARRLRADDRGGARPPIPPVDAPTTMARRSDSEAGEAARSTGAPVLRIAPEKVDNLLDRAGDLRVSARRLETFTAESIRGRERRSAATRSWRAMQRAVVAAASAAGDDKLLTAAAAAEAAWSDMSTELERLTAGVTETARRLTADTARVVDATQGLRMQPFGRVCEGLDRTVRDLAAAAGKEVRFSIAGAELEVDRSVGTALREPILHLTRNAVDHGIETPERRRLAGKTSTGSVHLTATIKEGGVEVSVSDDGAGVDVAALRHAADRQGRTRPDDDLELMFAAGLTTASHVTDVSGRGVGLDAVRTRIEQLSGAVEVETGIGRGTRVMLRLPRTLSTLRAVLVRAAGETIAMPVTSVQRLVRMSRSELREVDGRTFLILAGKAVPVISLGAALAFDATDSPAPRRDLDGVVVQAGAGETVVVVDALLDEAEILVKAVPARLAGLSGVLGAAILPDGHPSLVVSPAACVRAAAARGAALETGPRTKDTRVFCVLLAEDTVTTRVLEQSILEGAGYEVTVAANGAQAWRLLQEHGADIVVTDVDMPEMDGYALCAAIRGSARFQRLPVVLVTSLADEDDRRRGLELGANAYIVKSAFDQHALLAAIEQLL